MRKLASYTALSALLMISSIFFAYIWFEYYEHLSFINLPESAWLFLHERTAINKYDLEIIVGIFFGLIFSILMFALAYFIWMILGRLTKRSSGR